MYIYSTLENTSVQTIYLAYLQKSKFITSTKKVTFKAFFNMLQIRGYIPEISMGAFEKSDHNLVGFILNGFRTWNGKSTVYDILTGTVLSHRRQGIANTIFENLLILLRQKYAEQYMTEVTNLTKKTITKQLLTVRLSIALRLNKTSGNGCNPFGNFNHLGKIPFLPLMQLKDS
jgi:hypothetical protein